MKQKDQRRCVIVGGAPIIDYQNLIPYLREDDYLVFCDCGLKHLQMLQEAKGSVLVPDLIVGDFDSYENPHLDVETIVLPCIKDDTDTVFAVKEAVKRGFLDFLLVGVIGARLDHSLCNVSLLLYLDSLGKTGCIIDDYSEMEIVSSKAALIDERYSFFSLLNITGSAKGINISGAKYELTDAEISCEYQYGVSNEVTPGKTATVSVADGKLLLIKIRKEKHN